METYASKIIDKSQLSKEKRRAVAIGYRLVAARETADGRLLVTFTIPTGVSLGLDTSEAKSVSA